MIMNQNDLYVDNPGARRIATAVGCAMIVILTCCSSPGGNTSAKVIPREPRASDTTDRLSALRGYDFVDSTTFRTSGMILAIRSTPAPHTVSIDIFQRQADTLTVVQSIDSLPSQFGETEPVFRDFNGDSFRDFKLARGYGARSSNVYYYLFLQSPSTNLFTRIRGSESYPNVDYDPVRHTITACAYYAGTTYTDLEVVNDSIVPYGGVDISYGAEWITREYYSIDATGKRVMKKRDSIPNDGAVSE
jgi:hypothetical protein